MGFLEMLWEWGEERVNHGPVVVAEFGGLGDAIHDLDGFGGCVEVGEGWYAEDGEDGGVV